MNKVFLFDLDDTLMPNQHDYSVAQLALASYALEKFAAVKPVRKDVAEAQISFVNFVIDRLGMKAPDVHTILVLQADHFKKQSKKDDALSQSFVKTFQAICAGAYVTFTEDDLTQSYACGEGVKGVSSRDEGVFFVRDLISLEEKIDVGLVEHYGFAMERFPTSFREAYYQFFAHHGIPVRPGELREVYDIGMLAYDEHRWEEQGLVPGAEETLDFLLSKGDELVLVTKGDPRVQEKKISVHNLHRWFHRIHIVPRKTSTDLQRFVGTLPLSAAWHVGNSVRSDVLPAVNAGLGMVYVPCETWAYEKQHEGLPEYDRLFIINSLPDMRGLYDVL